MHPATTQACASHAGWTAARYKPASAHPASAAGSCASAFSGTRSCRPRRPLTKLAASIGFLLGVCRRCRRSPWPHAQVTTTAFLVTVTSPGAVPSGLVGTSPPSRRLAAVPRGRAQSGTAVPRRRGSGPSVPLRAPGARRADARSSARGLGCPRPRSPFYKGAYRRCRGEHPGGAPRGTARSGRIHRPCDCWAAGVRRSVDAGPPWPPF